MSVWPVLKKNRPNKMHFLLLALLWAGQQMPAAFADDLPRLEEQAIQAAATAVADSLVQIQIQRITTVCGHNDIKQPIDSLHGGCFDLRASSTVRFD